MPGQYRQYKYRRLARTGNHWQGRWHDLRLQHAKSGRPARILLHAKPGKQDLPCLKQSRGRTIPALVELCPRSGIPRRLKRRLQPACEPGSANLRGAAVQAWYRDVWGRPFSIWHIQQETAG